MRTASNIVIRKRSVGRRAFGFTLLEVLIALAVMVVAAGLIVPAYSAWMQGQNLSESVDSFRTNVVKARTRAMEEGRTYRVAWEVHGTTYRIAPDELEDWPELAGSAAGPLFSDAAGLPGLVLVGNLKEGVRFAPSIALASGPGALPPGSTATSDLGQIFVLFRPNGTASILVADGTERSQADIAITNEKGDQRYIRVRAVTGGTTVFIPSAP